MIIIGNCCNGRTRFDSVADGVNLPRSIGSTATIPSGLSNPSALVLVVKSLVQYAIEVSPLRGC